MTTKRAGLLDKYFYFFMSLLIAVIVVYGFSHTVDKALFHPDPPRPLLLYVHGAVFSTWVIFFIFQSALIRTHNVRIHRMTGWFGVALGVVIPILGVSIAFTMIPFDVHVLHATHAAPFILVPLFDMVEFTIPFALAIYWRKKPEFHRRLILMASCALTAAAFFRFPAQFHADTFFYAGVDLLILLGVVRDLIVDRRVHPVYRYGLPAFALAQSIVMYTLITTEPHWLKIANAIVG